MKLNLGVDVSCFLRDQEDSFSNCRRNNSVSLSIVFSKLILGAENEEIFNYFGRILINHTSNFFLTITFEKLNHIVVAPSPLKSCREMQTRPIVRAR